MSRIYELRRLLAVVFFAVLTAVVVLTMTTSTAWADPPKCNFADFADTSGYYACLAGSGSANVPVATEDLPVTGNNPVRTLVISSAFIVVGAAAIAGSMQTRRRARTSNF